MLKAHNVNKTEVVVMDMNALTHWGEIVKAVKDCTCVFNMIDVGDYWDLAVQALCLKYKIPFVSGGTFQSTVTVDFCPHHTGYACFACMSDLYNKQDSAKLTVDLIDTYDKIDFITKAVNPVGASNVMVAGVCAHLMVNAWIQDLMYHNASDAAKQEMQPVPSRFIFYLSTFETIKWNIEPVENCPLKCQEHISK